MKNRKGIYYWKCDRLTAFQSPSNQLDSKKALDLLSSVELLLKGVFGTKSFEVLTANGQGNHITYYIEEDEQTYFLRIEAGAECDNYMNVEASVLEKVRLSGVAAPRVYAVDTSRKKFPFSYQLLEFIDYPDLNILYKKEKFDLNKLAGEIGSSIAMWQKIPVKKFGFFDPSKLSEDKCLEGLDETYHEYFLTNWNNHLQYLVESGFLKKDQCLAIRKLVQEHEWCLKLDHGVLVHKDLALWNILGTKTSIKSFIDWDDTISGDPTDDISLLACFHSGDFIKEVMEGYQKVTELPANFECRFWLHLLRNMIVKAVIRVRGGYFNLNHDFFLIGTGETGLSLKNATQDRIQKACWGLKDQIKISEL